MDSTTSQFPLRLVTRVRVRTSVTVTLVVLRSVGVPWDPEPRQGRVVPICPYPLDVRLVTPVSCFRLVILHNTKITKGGG